MGAAWCRERAAHAHDSKSPLDRVIVSCVDKVYPQPKSPTAAVIPLDGDHRQRTYNITSVPLPAVHTPRRQNGGGAVAASGWQSADLEVPASTQRQPESTSEDCESIGPTPVPPPRKKRRARSSAATQGAAARVAAAQAAVAGAAVLAAGPPKAQRSVSTVVPPTIRTDDCDVRVQKLSTVSLPDYQQLDRPDKSHLSPGVGSGGATSLSSISEATVERLDAYLRRCRSFGSVNTEELVERLAAQSRPHSPSHSTGSSCGEESDDSWELGGLEDPVRPGEGPPLSPTHRLSGRRQRRLGVALPRGSLTSEDQPQPQPWFHSQREPRDATDSPSAFFAGNDRKPEESDTESGLREVRKELQSIVYDFNLYGNKENKSRADLEVLPTKPITQERKKKISIKSITPPPSPELTDHEEEPARNGEVDARTEVVSKILNGYEKVIASAATLRSPEAEAEAVLRQLGVPVNLAEASPAGSSRRSSMTPSLSELEAAISDLLEQTQADGGDDDDNASADNRINNMLEDGDKNKRPDGSVSQTTVPGTATAPGKTAGTGSENHNIDAPAPSNKGSCAVNAASGIEVRGPTKKGNPENLANGITRLPQNSSSNDSSSIPIDVSAGNENPNISILTDAS